MFKQIFTLARGRAADQADAFLDANSLALLRQQIRDAAVCVEKSRKTLAMVMAYSEREKVALQRINDKIADLELRATEALKSDQTELATEAASAIAHLEAERDATTQAVQNYSTEIARLRDSLTKNQTLLAELKRGQRLAEASDKAQRAQGQMTILKSSNLEEASTTLKRLQERQALSDAAIAAASQLAAPSNASATIDRLAAAGCGAPKQTTAEDVLKRLKSKSA